MRQTVFDWKSEISVCLSLFCLSIYTFHFEDKGELSSAGATHGCDGIISVVFFHGLP